MTDMRWRNELIKILKAEFESIRAKNPRYSIRAFAKKLRISHVALSQILRDNGKWKITAPRAVQLLENLNISKTSKKRLLTLMGLQEREKRSQVTADGFVILKDWRYPAILFSHDLVPEERSPAKLAEKFGLDSKDVSRIIQELAAQGYLRKSDTGNYERHTGHLSAEQGPPTEVIRQYHRNNLQLAAQAIDVVPATDRNYSSLMFAGSLKRLPEIQHEIQVFHDKIMNLMDGEDENDEIFLINVNVLPIRKKK